MVSKHFMFQNAMESLNDCLAELEQAKDEGMNFHSFYESLEGEEKEAFLDLRILCKEIIIITNQIK